MIPFSTCSKETLAAIKGVLTDIDDTLTTDGKLPASTYMSMEMLQKNGILVIPITGRPAGWCDAIARIWPVDAVIGENGAFYFRYDSQNRQMIRHFVDPIEKRLEDKVRLQSIANEVLATVKGSGISADQAYRETDLAIDFCEDVPRLPRQSVNKIVEIMSRFGLTVKVSSIHVNGWFGYYDKLTMSKVCARDCFDIDLTHKSQNFSLPVIRQTIVLCSSFSRILSGWLTYAILRGSWILHLNMSQRIEVEKVFRKSQRQYLRHKISCRSRRDPDP